MAVKGSGFRYGAVCAVLAVSLLSLPVAGHRLNHSLTEVVWHAPSRALEITHRIHLDDGVLLLARLGSLDAVLDARTMARLLAYVGDRFSLVSEVGDLRLDPVGAEIDGDVLFVYQECAETKPPLALKAANRLLQDYVPTHVNQVNVRIGGRVWSRSFVDGDPAAWLIAPRDTTAAASEQPGDH